MGIIILIIAAIIEITFAVYCIKSKSNQKESRNWVRIGALATFIVFTFSPVIQWGFRWKPLAAVLLIWAIIGGVSLIRKKEHKKEYKTRSIVLKALAMWFIVGIAVIPAFILPQFELPEVSGQFKVNTAVYTYTDSSRIEKFEDTGDNRKVTVEFWYPEDAKAKSPLIVFSHGAFGVRPSNTSTFNELASNGYIVCSIDHPYHSMYTKDTHGESTFVSRAFMQEVLDVNNGVYDYETSYKLTQKWLKVRTEDMNFVVDTIIKYAKDTSADEVYQQIDTNRIGLIGHSLGGAASVQLGRERSDIKAVINLDADMLGEEVGFKDGKPILNDKVYTVPIFSIYTDDMKNGFEKAKEQGFVTSRDMVAATAPKYYEVFIGGTNHMSLTDLPIVSPFLVRMISGTTDKMNNGEKADKYYVIKTMNKLVLEFFDYHLKDKGSFNPN